MATLVNECNSLLGSTAEFSGYKGGVIVCRCCPDQQRQVLGASPTRFDFGVPHPDYFGWHSLAQAIILMAQSDVVIRIDLIHPVPSVATAGRQNVTSVLQRI